MISSQTPVELSKQVGLATITSRALTTEQLTAISEPGQDISAQAKNFLRDIPSSSGGLPTFQTALSSSQEGGETHVIGAFSKRPERTTERLVGLMVLHTEASSDETKADTKAHLALVAVDRNLRRQGLAKLMLRSAREGLGLTSVTAREPVRTSKHLTLGTLRGIAKHNDIHLER